MNKKNIKYIIEHTLRCEVSYRGGGIEIDISEFIGIDEAKMSAYQNYLGGGIAGSIQTSTNVEVSELQPKKQEAMEEIAESLKRYFYSLNNGGGDDYMQENVTGKDAKDGYERLQGLSSSAY